jgi:hypothetical protein
MKNKILILIIACALIFSVNSAFAVEDVNNNLTVDSEIDIVEEVNIDIQSQDTLASDENVDDLSASSESQVIGDSPVYVNGKITNRYNNGVIYTATFYDDNGNVLKDAPIFCGVDDSEKGYNLNTDSNGIVQIPLQLSNGNHKLYLCSEYNFYDPVVDNIKLFNVLTGNKNIKMYYDDGTTYKVRVFDDNGNPAKAGQKVTFAIGKKLYYKKTDKNGYAKLKIPSTPGPYEIGAKYKDYVVVNSLLVKHVLKPLTSFKGNVKKTIKYKVKFLGKNKKNKKIIVKFNKKTYKAKTNKKGIATFVLKTPKKVGFYKLVASYKKTKITQTYSKYYA